MIAKMTLGKVKKTKNGCYIRLIINYSYKHISICSEKDLMSNQIGSVKKLVCNPLPYIKNIIQISRPI